MSLPRMSLHIGDYKKDTGHLRAAGHGGYLLLMMHYWATGGIPDDDKQLAAIACMTDREWKEWGPIIRPFFKESGLRHKRIEEELLAAQAKYDKRVQAGKKGGEAKAKNKQNSSNARAAPYQPITDNQEREERETRERAGELFLDFAKACRVDIDSPDLWGVQHHLDALIHRGFSRETVLAGTARAMAGKSKPPAWAYFLKCIESENEERSTPAKPEVQRAKASTTSPIMAAVREHRERLERQAGDDSGPRGDTTRLLSHG